MSDLGTTGRDSGQSTSRGSASPTVPAYGRIILGVGHDYERLLNTYLATQQVSSDGSPTSPCRKQYQPGQLRYLAPCKAGVNTFSILCKYFPNAAPYPTLTIKANPTLGIPADVTGTAGAGTGWITISPASVTTIADGVVELVTEVYIPTSEVPLAYAEWDFLTSPFVSDGFNAWFQDAPVVQVNSLGGAGSSGGGGGIAVAF